MRLEPACGDTWAMRRLAAKASTGLVHAAAKGRIVLVRRVDEVLDRPRWVWLLLILAATLPLLVFAAGAAYFSAERTRADAWRTASSLAARVSERVTAELSSQLAMTEILAASTALDIGDLQAFRLEAQRVQDDCPLWYTIELARPSGLQVLNLLRQSGVALGPTADLASFDQVVRTRRPVVGGIGPVGLVSGRRLVTLRAPVIRGGVLRYVLSAAVAPSAVSAILRQASLPSKWLGVIVDQTGHIVARTLDERGRVGGLAAGSLLRAISRHQSGSYTGRTLEGVQSYVVFRPLSGTDGWSVHLAIPQTTLLRPIRRSLAVLLGGAIASLLLASGLVTLIARAVARRRSREQERAAHALRISEESRLLAVEAADLGTWRLDPSTGAFSGSDRCLAMLGLSDEAPSWAACVRAIHPDDRTTFAATVQERRRLGGWLDAEFRVGAGEAVRWMRMTGRSLSDGNGAVLGVITDVSARRGAETERLALQSRFQDAQEEERRRIARDLHDHVGQTVTGLSLGLAALNTMMEEAGCDEACRDRTSVLRKLAADIGRDIHHAASDLRPAALDAFGLREALIAHTADWSEQYGIAVDVHAPSLDARLPPPIEIAIYRVVQEALTNVIKHADARSVSVVLDRIHDSIQVVIEDDGRGFNLPSAGSESGRLGLSGMRERVGLIGGTMTIETASGSGTTLFVRVPLPPNGSGPA